MLFGGALAQFRNESRLSHLHRGDNWMHPDPRRRLLLFHRIPYFLHGLERDVCPEIWRAAAGRLEIIYGSFLCVCSPLQRIN